MKIKLKCVAASKRPLVNAATVINSVFICSCVAYSTESLKGPPVVWCVWKTVNGNGSTGECFKAHVIGPVIRLQGGHVVHVSSSGVIFHDGQGRLLWFIGARGPQSTRT